MRTNTYGTMTSLTSTSTYTFGNTENVTDTLTASWTTNRFKDQIIYDNNGGISDASIDFTGIDGTGLYYTANNLYGEDNTTIHYYRGAVQNNYVLFGGFYWRIVRTTSEGGVKLVFSGKTLSGYSGYVFSPTSYVDLDYYRPINNQYKGSDIQKRIDAWYWNNFLDYSAYLSDTAIYCNDTSGSESAYGSNIRLKTNKRPSFECPSTGTQGTGRYTKASGLLTYPVATLSADEVYYAGVIEGYDKPNTSSYILQNGSTFWTMSPAYYQNSQDVILWLVSGNGYMINSYGASTYGARAVISLKPCVTYLKGNGSVGTPYEVSNASC